MVAVVPLLTAVFLLLGFGVLVFASHGPANGHLVEVGPTHPDYGFPMWYKDANGLILEQCLDPNYCGFLPGDIPDPNAPLSIPDNFPEEAFYWLGEALMLDATPNGGTAILTLALEGAFNGGPPAVNDQIVFGRIRIRVDNLVQGETYTVTHPYGVEIFPDLGNDAGPGTAAGPGISFVEDIGIGAPGDFTGALNSRIGPFLTAAPNGPTPPPGFIGDGGLTEQRVVGSPYGTNFYRIEGTNVGAPGSPFLCADPALGPDPTATTDCIETDMFTLLGQIAANFGVESQAATYSRDGNGDGSLDIFASTVPGEIIEAEGNNIGVLTLDGDGNGNYFSRTNFVGSPPAAITLSNVSDAPPTLVNTAVTDMVIITKAEYDQDTGALTVEAYSSDAYSLPTLTAVGYGDLSPTGSFAVSQGVFGGLTFPPASVTVVSAAGGSDTEPVQVVSSSWNVAPYAIDDTAATSEETAVTINVTANDYDYDTIDTIQPATATLVDLPQNGSVVNNGDGTFTYTPDTNFVGTDRFRYTVQDSRGATS
ncbi:MAG TPA: hypothetical protein ENK32_10465, partial [Anaerolineae bacterium]|nr:hypothetical protein [Anaerolineae bacterium]